MYYLITTQVQITSIHMLNYLKHIPKTSKQDEVQQNKQIKQQLHKELPIVEAYAVVHPRTVMIHVQHADITHRAVMTPLRLKSVTYQTVPLPLVLLITYVEAPVQGDEAWNSLHGHYERPHHHEQNEVIHQL